MIHTEEEARNWIASSFDVSRETSAKLTELSRLVEQENAHQNLVAASTLDQVWRRHVADSAQLILHAGADDSSWLDIGTGAGFPGLVVAILHRGPVTLVEPRKLRAEFLRRAAEMLAIRPTIVTSKVEQLPPATYDIISARAVSLLPNLLRIAQPFSTEKTRLIFPKGRNAQSELEAAEAAWQGVFRSEPSLTDPEARIVIVEGLRGPRRRART